jgi:tRNA threonylcarbamoyl adenosine modification protein (Sua5/YciO/YrdC/YwlC family)
MCNTIYKSTDHDAISKTVKSLQAGNLAIIPTDTVYGVAAQPNISSAIEKIYEAKARDGKRPIAFLASDIDVIEKKAILSDASKELAAKHWPGALTLILKMKTGEYEGFRIPDHDFSRELIRQAGGLLKVTSANLSGEPDACTIEDAVKAIGSYVSTSIDDGQSPGGIASTVVKDDPEKGLTILRQGSVKI